MWLGRYAAPVSGAALEEGLSYTFGAPVSIEDVCFSWSRGTLDIYELVVQNPEEFDQDAPAITCSQVQIDFDTLSLARGIARAPVVRLEQIEANLVHDPRHGLNLNRLRDNALGVVDKADAVLPFALRKRIRVDRLEAGGGKVRIASALLPAAGLGLNLTPFVVEDLGADGLTAPELCAAGIRAILQESLSLKGLSASVREALER